MAIKNLNTELVDFTKNGITDKVYRYKYSRKVPDFLVDDLGIRYFQVFLGYNLPMAIEECGGLSKLHDSCFKILRSKRSDDKSRKFALTVLGTCARLLKNTSEID
jgi:hypothetical protein